MSKGTFMRTGGPPHSRPKIPRIINLFGDGGRYAGQIRNADTHEMHFFRYSFDDYMSVDPTGVSYRANKENLRETVEEAYLGGYDACACDSNDALLLQFFAQKRGFAPITFLINDVDKFEMAGWVNNFIRHYYQEDVFQHFASSPRNCWMHIIKSRSKFYTALGIVEANLFYIPMSEAAIEFTFPGFFKSYHADETGSHGRFKNKIIAVGTHNRDYETLVKAATIAGVEVHIITNLKINPPIEAAGVFWHDSLPEADFNSAIRDAKCIVIPLRVDNRASGQMGCAIAMKMGKAVVTTRCESVCDHILDGKTGFLYTNGSAEELAKVLRKVSGSTDALKRVGDNARKRERALSAVASESHLKIS